MKKSLPERFHLRNLDCAACAVKLENGLNMDPGIRHASVDFANLVLVGAPVDYHDNGNVGHLRGEMP